MGDQPGDQRSQVNHLDDAQWLAGECESRSASSIARELGVAPDTVLRAMRLHGIPVRFATSQRPTPRAELDDASWLAERHERMTPAAVADELGVAESTVRRALERHGIRLRTRSTGQRFRSPPELNDPAWLAEQYETKPASRITRELGVSKEAVHKAMVRHDVEAEGPWVRRDTTRLQQPARAQLEQVWNEAGTIKAVALRFNVSHNTAVIWLADVGIFVKDTPAISRSDLVAAIEAGRTIRQIAAEHRVTGRTVQVELRRFGLVEAHRRRPVH